ncbi:MAG: SocA family protein [Nitrospirae bacterium]|nr:SocA family protein [Nitrospirota bacterium]
METKDIYEPEYGLELRQNNDSRKDKLKSLIAAILGKAGKTPKVKLAKLVLFAEIEYYKITGESITGLYFIRLSNGPVIDFFDEMLEEGIGTLWTKETSIVPIYTKGINRKQYTYCALMNKTKLSPDLQGNVNSVVDTYGKMTGTELSNLSHRLPAWRYSEPNEPIYLAELALDKDEDYFVMLDMVEELDDAEDDYLEEELLRILPKA